jgi:hypothetical protein
MLKALTIAAVGLVASMAIATAVHAEGPARPPANTDGKAAKGPKTPDRPAAYKETMEIMSITKAPTDGKTKTP